jgi:hypothetical protein
MNKVGNEISNVSKRTHVILDAMKKQLHRKNNDDTVIILQRTYEYESLEVGILA